MKGLLALAFVCLASASAASAQPAQTTAPKAPVDPHAGHHQQPSAEQPTPAQKWFTDVSLLTQDGKPVRFYSDVLKGKTVVVNAFFTTCTSVCPPMSRNMEKIQEALGDRVGRDVFLVSVTVDPATDTPPRLKEYAAKFHARPGWTFLTGKKENVDWALYKLGQYVESKDDHKTVIIIGNEKTGLWKKALGMARADELIQIVRGVADDKGDPKGEPAAVTPQPETTKPQPETNPRRPPSRRAPARRRPSSNQTRRTTRN